MEKARSYSALVIINPDKMESIEDVKKSVQSIITSNSGEITKENMMGKRALAYPIKKSKEGIYYEIVFKADPSHITKISRLFQIHNDIIRALIDKQEA